MDAITFDNEVEWDGEYITVWANHGKERIRCQIGRASINDLPGFTIASSKEIDMRKLELVELIKPNAVNMIRSAKYDQNLTIRTVRVKWEELAK